MTKKAMKATNPKSEAPAKRLPSGWLLRRDAAAYLGLSVSTLGHWASLRIGPQYYKAGKFTRYRIADLDAWLSSGLARPLSQEVQSYLRMRPMRPRPGGNSLDKS